MRASLRSIACAVIQSLESRRLLATLGIAPVGTFDVIDSFNGDQTPHVLATTPLANHTTLVAYLRPTSGGEANVMAGIYDAHGEEVAPPTIVNAQPAAADARLAADSDADGNAVLVWNDAAGTPGDQDIVGVSVDSQGTIGDPFVLIGVQEGHSIERDAAIDVAADGTFMVACTSTAPNANEAQVVVARFDSSFETLAGPVTASTFNALTTNEVKNAIPAVQYNPGGVSMVVWRLYTDDSKGAFVEAGILARELDDSGSMASPPHSLFTFPSDQFISDISFGGSSFGATQVPVILFNLEFHDPDDLVPTGDTAIFQLGLNSDFTPDGTPTTLSRTDAAVKVIWPKILPFAPVGFGGALTMLVEGPRTGSSPFFQGNSVDVFRIASNRAQSHEVAHFTAAGINSLDFGLGDFDGSGNGFFVYVRDNSDVAAAGNVSVVIQPLKLTVGDLPILSAHAEDGIINASNYSDSDRPFEEISLNFNVAPDVDTPIIYDLGGKAVEGTDYEIVPASPVMPAGSKHTIVRVRWLHSVELGETQAMIFTPLPDNDYVVSTSPVNVTAKGPLEKFDFGDAPDKYKTKLASNGARHAFEPVNPTFLGKLRDNETDGQPNAAATGDDTHAKADEDGIVFGKTLITGKKAGVTATAHVPAVFDHAHLDAWVDFNRDGDWLDAGEHVLVAVVAHNGANKYSFTIPPKAKAGATYARFRIAPEDSEGTPDPFGLQIGGEVEDYRITIAQGKPVVSLATVNGTATEGGAPAQITVSRTGPKTDALKVKLSFSGDATKGTDYKNIPSPITIPGGKSSVTLNISALADALTESPEQVIVGIISSPEYFLDVDASVATLTLMDAAG